MRVIIEIYRYCISPLLLSRCRFQPTCSEYAKLAFQRFSFWRACGIMLARLVRCHPLCAGGYDPVPPAKHQKCE